MTHHRDFFVWARFVAYFKKLWAEQWRTYAVAAGVFTGACLLLELWVAFTAYPFYSGYDVTDTSAKSDNTHVVLGALLVVMMFVSGCLMASRILRGGRRKGERIAMLTTPVTAFENWLARWLLCVPLTSVALLACFYVADVVRVAVCAPLFPESSVSLLPLWPATLTDMRYEFSVVCLYALCRAVYAAGGVFFTHKPMLKTSVFMFFAGWFFLMMALNNNHFLFADDGFVSMLSHIYGWCATVFLWWLSYARFKELDITD